MNHAVPPSPPCERRTKGLGIAGWHQQCPELLASASKVFPGRATDNVKVNSASDTPASAIVGMSGPKGLRLLCLIASERNFFSFT